MILEIIALVLVATALGAYNVDEQKSGSPIGWMMQQTDEEMMARMTKMMDQCSQLMENKSELKKDESSKQHRKNGC